MIKECPFCGGEAEIYEGEFEGERVFNVSCSECCATTPCCETKKIAVEIWNERTDLLSENKDGLLCCPCCGGEAEIGKIEDSGNVFYVVFCSDCGLTSQGSCDEDEIVSVWNKRR